MKPFCQEIRNQYDVSPICSCEILHYVAYLLAKLSVKMSLIINKKKFQVIFGGKIDRNDRKSIKRRRVRVKSMGVEVGIIEYIK